MLSYWDKGQYSIAPLEAFKCTCYIPCMYSCTVMFHVGYECDLLLLSFFDNEQSMKIVNFYVTGSEAV